MRDNLQSDSVVLVEDDWVGLSPQERTTGRNNFDFYCFLLWPFVETCEASSYVARHHIDLDSSHRLARGCLIVRLDSGRRAPGRPKQSAMVRREVVPQECAAARQERVLPGRHLVPRVGQPG